MPEYCPIRGCREPQGDGQSARPIPPGAVICVPHWHRVRHSVVQLPGLYLELALALVPGQRNDSEYVRGSKTPPIPLDLGARTCQEDILALLRDTERRYRHHKGWPRRPKRGREPNTVKGSAAWITRQLDGILPTTDRFGPLGIDFAVAVLDVNGRAHALLSHGRLVHRLPEPCPNCDMKALERANGADRVKCRYCGLDFDEDEYDRLIAWIADEAEKRKPR